MRPGPKCHFVPRLPSGSPKPAPKCQFVPIEALTTLGAHNFVCRPPIEMKFFSQFNQIPEIFVVALVESFPMVCGTPPTHKEIGAILDF